VGPFAGNDRRVADLDANDIGNRVERPRRPVEWHTEIPRARLGLLRVRGGGEEKESV
jgi:hypothetical protein